MAVPPVSGLADRALEALMGRSGRESRDLTEHEWAERIEQERRRVAVVEAERVRVARRAQLDLFDLSDIRTEQREDEPAEGSEQETYDRHLEALPPSYSLAEGLDQLPDYSAAEVLLTFHQLKQIIIHVLTFQVNRVKIGPYVMVYDKQNKNLSTFKK